MKNIFAFTKIISLFVVSILCNNQTQGQNILYTMLEGDTAYFSVSGANGAAKQWQQSTDSIVWADIPGATSANQTIVMTPSSTGKRYFRTNVSGNSYCADVKSSIIRCKILSNITQLQIGDLFHGGIVFNTDTSGHGLISSQQDQSSVVEWGCNGTDITGAVSLTDGASNTMSIVSACATRPIAASLCDSLTLNGYNDWFLPAKEQLNDLYQTQYYVGGFSHGDINNYYWSSTQNGPNEAWFQYFMTGGYQGSSYKGDGRVRCVRAYEPIENSGRIICKATVNIPPVYENEEICLVTVDTTVWKNKIIYEKTSNVGTVSFNIYKQTGIDEYTLIGNVPFYQPSFFIDNNSQPESHGDIYKISVLDSCGHESDLSFFHKTINLTIAVNGTTMGLNWDDYVDESGDFVPAKFYIFRGTNIHNLALYDSITASLHSYNDIDITSTYFYMIGIKKINGCNVDKSSSNMAFSNKKQNYSIGIEQVENNDSFKIYPNPFNKSTTITFENKSHYKYKVSISDITGNVLRIYDNITTDKFEVEKGDLKNGIYFFDIIGEKAIRGKFIVE